MSTRSISWGKGCPCVRLTTLPPSCAVVMKSGNLNFLELSGSLQACNGTAFTQFSSLHNYVHNFKCAHGKFWEPLIRTEKCKNIGVQILGINSTVSGYSVHIGSIEISRSMEARNFLAQWVTSFLNNNTILCSY